MQIDDGDKNGFSDAAGLPTWYGALLVALVAFAVSANTLLNGFVYDDNLNILQNPWIRDPAQLGEAFTRQVAAFNPNTNSSFYRPLMHVIYAASYAVFGQQAWGFHLVNLLFNVANSVCVYYLLSRYCCAITSPDSPDATGSWKRLLASGPLLGAFMFAVHTIHTESVAWLAGITDLSYSLFFLLSLLLATDERAPRLVRIIVAPALFFIGMLCKEPAVVLLPILIVVFVIQGNFSLARRREVILQLSVFFAATVAYFVLRVKALGGFAGSDRRIQVGIWESLATSIALFGEYLKKLIAPTGLSPLHDFQVVTSALDPRLWLGVVALIVVVVIALRFSRNTAVLLGLILLVLPLVPTMYLPALGEGLFAERYLFLPSVGAVLLLSLGLQAMTANPAARTLLVGAVATTGLLFSVATFERNIVWRSDLTLWTDTVRKVPSKAGAHEGLGYALYVARRYDAAAASFQQALKLNPQLTDARINLAASLTALGRVEEAIDQAQIALREKPRSAEAYGVMGWSLMAQNRIREGIAAYERALAINPLLSTAHNSLGIAYAQTGDLDRATWHFQEAVRLDPENPDYIRNRDLLPH